MQLSSVRCRSRALTRSAAVYLAVLRWAPGSKLLSRQCEGPKTSWLWMRTHTTCSTASVGPPAGGVVAAHHIKRTAPGRFKATCSQDSRAHARPSALTEHGSTFDSVRRELYQCLPDPEADAGSSMRLPYLRENIRTMADWKGYRQTAGDQPLSTGRWYSSGSCQSIVKARVRGLTLSASKCFHDTSSHPDCNIRNHAMKTSAGRGWKRRSINDDRRSPSIGNRDFHGSRSCCAERIEGWPTGRGSIKSDERGSQDAVSNAPPWQAEPVMRGFPRSASYADCSTASVNVSDVLAAATGAEALRVLQEGLQGGKARRSSKAFTKQQTESPTDVTSSGKRYLHGHQSTLRRMNCFESQRCRKSPFSWLDLVKQHTADYSP